MNEHWYKQAVSGVAGSSCPVKSHWLLFNCWFFQHWSHRISLLSVDRDLLFICGSYDGNTECCNYVCPVFTVCIINLCDSMKHKSCVLFQNSSYYPIKCFTSENYEPDINEPSLLVGEYCTLCWCMHLCACMFSHICAARFRIAQTMIVSFLANTEGLHSATDLVNIQYETFLTTHSDSWQWLVYCLTHSWEQWNIIII